MSFATQAHVYESAASPLPSLQPLATFDSQEPFTRVSLVYIEQRINLYLRFGHPARTVQLNRWRRCAMFLPNAIFCRIRWEANDYGTTRWQLMVLQACTPLDVRQNIPGVRPGARLLLRAEGEQTVRTVLAQIDAIESRGIDSADVSPTYWRTLGNRLAARLPVPDYTDERHAAWLVGRALR